MFTNGPRDLGSIPGRVIPKTRQMVLDATLLNTHYYKVQIKVKWSNPGNGVVPSLHLSVVAIERSLANTHTHTHTMFDGGGIMKLEKNS